MATSRSCPSTAWPAAIRSVVAGDSLAFATFAENIPVPGEYRFDFMFTVRETGEDYRLTFRVDLTDAD